MEAPQYLALLGLWIAGIVAPGPDVLVILRNASLGSRAAGVLTAVGVMTGNLVWITLSLTGVTVLIGRADRIMFSSAGRSLLYIWTWRPDRFLKAVH